MSRARRLFVSLSPCTTTSLSRVRCRAVAHKTRAIKLQRPYTCNIAQVKPIAERGRDCMVTVPAPPHLILSFCTGLRILARTTWTDGFCSCCGLRLDLSPHPHPGATTAAIPAQHAQDGPRCIVIQQGPELREGYYYPFSCPHLVALTGCCRRADRPAMASKERATALLTMRQASVWSRRNTDGTRLVVDICSYTTMILPPYSIGLGIGLAQILTSMMTVELCI